MEMEGHKQDLDDCVWLQVGEREIRVNVVIVEIVPETIITMADNVAVTMIYYRLAVVEVMSRVDHIGNCHRTEQVLISFVVHQN